MEMPEGLHNPAGISITQDELEAVHLA